ncbi:MAG: TonB-dependent receptor [Bryobacterales bacterium]|nr:TonB-dependent receptor [Bryobacterales bacterium]
MAQITFAMACSACLVGAAETDTVVDPDSLALESLLKMEVTTASKFPEKLSAAPGVVSVITQDELKRFGVLTVGEALERVPGLAPTSSYFSDRNMFAVRGDYVKDNGSHVLLLINGRPTRETLDGGVMSDLLQSFPVNALERIEVIRGPGSVLYGSNAFSGVINLITKKARGQSASARAFATGGGSGGSAELTFERGDLSILVAGQTRQNPPRRTNFVYPLLPEIGLYGTSEPIAVPDRGNGAYLCIDFKGLQFMGAYLQDESMAFPLVPSNTRSHRGFTNLGYSLSPTARWQMRLDLTHTLTRLDTSAFPFISRSGSDTVAEWTNIVRVTAGDTVTFGALYNYIEGTELTTSPPPSVIGSQGSRRAPGVYWQWEHRFHDAFKLVGGLQSNKIGHLDWNTVPRAGAIWSPAKHIHIKTLYGRAFRAPSINELHLVNIGLMGNLNLQPEYVRTIDVSLSYQTNRFLAALTYFHSRQSGIIRGVLSEFPNPPQYRNLGTVRIAGFETEVKQYITDRLFYSGSLLYTRNTTDAPTGAGHLTGPGWNASTGISYQDRRSYTLSLQGAFRPRIPAPGYGNPASESYQQLNAHARFELSRLFGDSTRGLALFAHSLNLANQKAWLPAGHLQLGFPFQRGRTLYYGIEASFARD